ncbi:MAG: hypothetical protein PHP17_04670 [Candidatus Omnitrophica bacterium]|nr:hypothetical protein [Candidatus Omnitrophota bacterium]
MDKRKAKKVTVLLYIMVVIFCFLIGTAFSSVYRRVPAMRMRYQAEAMQAKDAAEGKSPGNNQQRNEVRKDVLEDFVYEALYKPIRSINTNWKHHVDGSLQAERRRVIDEKYNSEK